MSHRAEDLKGRAKEAAGDLTDDRQLENEGKIEQAKATVKEKLDEATDRVKQLLDRK